MRCTREYKTGDCIGTTVCDKHYAQRPCYQPKCSMCAACVHAGDDCSDFDWKKMKPFSRIDDVIIVICSKFVSVRTI